MDKFFWSVWSWLWNDSHTNSIKSTTTTIITPTPIDVIQNKFTLLPAINLTELTTTATTTTTASTISSTTLPPTVEIRPITEQQQISTTISTTSRINLTRNNDTTTVTEFLINISDNIKRTLGLTKDNETTTTESLSSIPISSISESSSSSTSTSEILSSETFLNNLTTETIATTKTTHALKFSSILDYDTIYNYSSSDIFNNFTITSNQTAGINLSTSGYVDETFFDSNVIGSGGGVGVSSTEEFLLDALWNCTNLNDCCNNRNSFTAITFDRNSNGTIVNCTNSSDIFGGYDIETALHLVTVFGTAIILGIIILATVIGNVFVIAAILLERNLQSVANYLILSLAVADLLVACLVMPLSAVYEVSKEWKLGPELCDMWTSCDVLCCTASILHLVAIALDRYWAVTNIDYIHQRTARRIGVMILVIWALSFLVSIAPLLGWKDPKWDERVSKDLQCIVSQDIGYQIFATASSFYVPLLVILVLYWRIFQTARKRIRRRQQVTATQPTSGGLIATAAGGSGGIAAAVVTVIGRPLPTISETTTAFTNISSTHTSPEKVSYGNGVDRIENDPPTADVSTYGGSNAGTPGFRPTITRKRTQTSVDSKRERKAAKTLAIITGAFVCCWLPFFILAILSPTCQCNISPLAMSLSLWLGYFNSTLNPIIYTIFSPEFRHAFKRILCGRRNSIRRRTRCVRR